MLRSLFRFSIMGSLLSGLAALAAVPAVHADVLLPGTTAVSLQRHDAGTFYVKAAMAGYGDLMLLVDTGSSYLVINEEILARLVKSGEASYSRELSGSMADGSRRIIPVYRVGALRLGENCWIHEVEAAVFPGATRAILGMNVLSRLSPFAFSAEPAVLALNRCEAQLEAASEPQAAGAPLAAR